MRILWCLFFFILFWANPLLADNPRTVSLSWYPNTEVDLKSYTIYRGMISCETQGPLQPLAIVDKSITTYIDSTVPQTTSVVCYRLTASDISENESPQSDQISKFFSQLPPPPTTHIVQNMKVETDGTLVTFSWSPGICTMKYQLMRYGTRNNTMISETKGNFILYTLPKGSNSQYFISSVCEDGSTYNSTLKFTIKQGLVEVKQ